MSSKFLRRIFALLALLAGVGAVAPWSLASIEARGAESAAGESSHESDESHGGGHGGGHADLGHGDASDRLAGADDFRTDLAIYTFIVFLLLLGILSSVAWPKISAALVEREKRIENAIAEAEAKHESAKRLLAEHEAKLATAADQVRAMVEEARRDAETTKEQIVAEAHAAADKEKKRAVRDVEMATDQAMKKIAETSAQLAVQLAGQVVGEQLTSNPAKQAELVRNALSQLTSLSPSNN